MSSAGSNGTKCNRTWRHSGLWCAMVAMVVVNGAAQAQAQCVDPQMLTASDAAAEDRFARDVSVSGNTAVVGAAGNDCAAGDNCGAAYVFRFNGTSWDQAQKLTASDAASHDSFGFSVSVSGDIAVVGAYLDSCEAGFGCGSAYVFRFNGTSWVQEQKLTASDAAAEDRFGSSISVSGDTIVVGAFQDDCTAGTWCGSAYAFRFNGISWVQEQKLTASDAAANDNFGFSVSVSGDTIVTGAFRDGCASGGLLCGSAYVFRFDGTSWVEEQKLIHSNEGSGFFFGISVSVSGDTVMVGAINDYYCAPSVASCGSVSVFRFNGISWVEEQKLIASDADDGDRFGASVSVNGTRAVVGADANDCAAGDDCGSAYSFRFDGTQWVQEQKLTSSAAGANDRFGSSVSVSGGAVVMGARFNDCAAGIDCGAAYVFSCGPAPPPDCSGVSNCSGNGTCVDTDVCTCDVGWRGADCSMSTCAAVNDCSGNGTCLGNDVCVCDPGWTGADCSMTQCVDQQILTAPDEAAGDRFAGGVSVSGNTALVGAAGDACAAGEHCGAAYVFRFNGTSWNQEQKLTASDAADGASFGGHVSVSGDTALVGASGDACATGAFGCGAAYVFRFNGTSWVQEQKLTASDAVAGDSFGFSVSVSGNTAVVGAFQDDCTAGRWCGSAYVFRFNGTSWVQEQKLTASDAAEGDSFGLSVSVSGNTVVAGAFRDGCVSGQPLCGSAYVFRFDGTSWVEEQKLISSPEGSGFFFGGSVSVSGDTAMVGAINDYYCAPGAAGCGAVSVFRFNGISWVQEQKLIASDADGGDDFGASVSVNGARAVVGADANDCAAGDDCGSAYIFRFDGTQWVQEQKLTSSAAGANDEFGSSVSVSGGAVVMGAQFNDCAAGIDCGSAYVFSCGPTPPPDCGGVNNCSGHGMCVDTDVCTCDAGWRGADCSMFVCAVVNDCSGNGMCVDADVCVCDAGWTGADCSMFTCAEANDCSGNGTCVDADVCVCDAGWAGADCSVAQCVDQQILTASDEAAGDKFAGCVSVSGNTALVGAGGDTCAAGEHCGAAYVFRFNGTSWDQEQKLTASDAAASASFGAHVSVSGDTALVGASGDTCATGLGCGAAYVFRFNGTSWVQEQKLTASDAVAGDNFGFSVSVSGNTVVVGALQDDCTAGFGCGAAYVFRFNGTSWVQEQKLTASDAGADDNFGLSVSVSGDTVVTGAPRNGCASGQLFCGSAYVFRFDGTSWVEEQKLISSPEGSGFFFGFSVSVSGDTAMVGAINDYYCAPGAVGCGSVSVFRFNGISWVDEQKLIASDADGGDNFGASVSVSGARAVVGADRDGCAAGDDCGSAYIFRFDGTQWVQEQKLTSSIVGANDEFGGSVSVSGDTVVMGTQFNDCAAGIDCGSAYVFRCGSMDCSGVNNCSGHGICVDTDVCVCDMGWMGPDCSISACAAVNECSGNGMCVDADVCVCNAGWTGADCSMFTCAAVNECSGNGTCVAPNVCECVNGHSGPECSVSIPTVSQWGLVIMSMLLLVVGTILMRRTANAPGSA